MFVKPYSERTAEVIDKASMELVESAYSKAKQLLTEHSEGHRKVAELLLEREVIFREDVERILGPRPWKDEDETKEEKDKGQEKEEAVEEKGPATEEAGNKSEESSENSNEVRE